MIKYQCRRAILNFDSALTKLILGVFLGLLFVCLLANCRLRRIRPDDHKTQKSHLCLELLWCKSDLNSWFKIHSSVMAFCTTTLLKWLTMSLLPYMWALHFQVATNAAPKGPQCDGCRMTNSEGVLQQPACSLLNTNSWGMTAISVSVESLWFIW